MQIRNFLMVLVVATLVGCAGTPKVPLSEHLQTTGDISAPEQVSIIDTPDYEGPGKVWAKAVAQGVGDVAGPSLLTASIQTGSAIAAGENLKGGQKRVFDLVVNNEIDLQSMVMAEFQTRLENSALNERVVEGATDHQLDISIARWGLETNNGFSNKLSTVMTIVVSLKDEQGQEIWRDSSFVSDSLNRTGEKYSLDEYEENPELLKEQYALAINRIMDNIFTVIDEEMVPTSATM